MSMYIWHFPLYQVIRIFSLKIPMQQYYSKIWFYLLIIIFIIGMSWMSSRMIEPRINAKVEEILKTIHHENNG